MTINECHPTWKIFRTEAEDSWAFGLYNTCYEEGAEGRKVNYRLEQFQKLNSTSQDFFCLY